MTDTTATKEKKTTTKASSDRYVEGIGRRKTAVARVRISEGSKKGTIQVNGKKFEEYFPQLSHQQLIVAPLKAADAEKDFFISVHVSGSGTASQAGAMRHGIARALISHTPELRKKLKSFGYLTRDPRMVERKKYGLKKARRAPQWSKR